MNNERKINVFVILDNKLELVSFPCERGKFLNKFCKEDGTPKENYVEISQFEKEWFYNVIDSDTLSNIFSIELLLRFEKQFIINSIKRDKKNIFHIFESGIELDDEVYREVEKKLEK